MEGKLLFHSCLTYLDRQTHIHFSESLQLEVTYVGDLLYRKRTKAGKDLFVKPQRTILKDKQMGFLTSQSNIPIGQRTAWAELEKPMADLGDVFPSLP